MGGPFTEDQATSWAQYLDLVYSHYGTLYDMIPNAPQPSNDLSRPNLEYHADGMVGSIKTKSTTQSIGKQGPLASTLASS